MRFLWSIIFFISVVYGVEVDSGVSFQEILSKSSYYIDYNNSATINNIANKPFKPIKSKELGFGYSPNFTVWIKFALTNKSKKEVTKIIEYANPLTSYVEFYDAKSKKLLKSSGMLNKNCNESINPVLNITLKPFESKSFYLKISSDVTTLIAKLNIWNIKEHNKKQKQNQIILALFFGAMGIIILYNSVIFFMVRKKMYLYYVLAFIGILTYYLLYQGIAPLFFPKAVMRIFNNLIPFIVLLPVVFLSLFTKEILKLNSKPKLNKIFNTVLIAIVILTFLFYAFNLHSLRNLLFVILFFILFAITLLFLKSNSYAKYLLISWIVFFSTALFMYLENIQLFSMSSIFPYYSEAALLFEALSFSLILAHSIERLELDKIKAKNEIKYKELAINELDHRISGLLQSFMFKLEQEEKKKGINLKSLKQNIFAIAEINRHLNTTQSFPNVDMQEYFSTIIKSLQKIYNCPNIDIKVESNIVLKPKKAKTCAKILAEAVTNIYKYAYSDKCGDATVLLKEENGYFAFIIKDSGKGINNIREGAKGLLLIEDMAKNELNGTIDINSFNGVKIAIRWQTDG